MRAFVANKTNDRVASDARAYCGPNNEFDAQLAAFDRVVCLPRDKFFKFGNCFNDANKAIEGLTALDINVGVVEIIEAAKMSVKTGNSVALPLQA